MTQPRLPRILPLALAMVIYFTLSTNASAGFIVATADTVSRSPLEFSNGETGSSQSQPTKAPLPRTDKETLTDTAPLSGMSSPTSLSNVTSGGAAFAMLPTTPIDVPTLLITQLGPEGRVWLPPPFSTGVFRPPRFVG